ncbi:protein-disulfide reductase DsbD, partial [Vibrio parahaemolyticus]|nr:protein-disulfide reductase DsbD [Vibrio parahaemolyticus]
VYVQGMALTYTLLGLVVASAGMQFQAAMQHPYVLIGLSILFVTLALSMFGVYTLQLPSSVQTWLNNLSNKQQGGSSAGVFAMGAISGLVCSPCTTAPLSGALLYVAQSGDLLTGGIALYALAMGMGIPLILVAVFGNKLLPKAGGWMDRVKTLFGFILLAAPIFLLERILPEMWSTALWSALGIAAFGWLYHIKNSLEFGGWKQSAIGIIAVLGLFASAQPTLNYWFGNHETQAQQTTVSFTRIANVAELEEQLALAKAAGKPVMLDFYADWCVACKEFEK